MLITSDYILTSPEGLHSCLTFVSFRPVILPGDTRTGLELCQPTHGLPFELFPSSMIPLGNSNVNDFYVNYVYCVILPPLTQGRLCDIFWFMF